MLSVPGCRILFREYDVSSARPHSLASVAALSGAAASRHRRSPERQPLESLAAHRPL
jgi:hypothetical protein